MSFTILHLSDLHITEKVNSTVLKNLIYDIERQCADYDKIIIVVTGDIIDKGKFNITTKNSVYDFFSSIKNSLGSRIKGLFFTSGNHDKVINENIDKLLVEPIIDKEIVDIQEDDWENYYLVSYKPYLELINSIYKQIFFDYEFTNFVCNDTYTFNFVEIDNVLFACINLDTSWSASGGKGDFRKLRLDRTHLQKLQLEYQQFLSNNRNKKIVTCVISHHPINWLNEKDERFILPWLLNYEYFNANLYLCGHTHDRKVQNFYDNVHSYLTLVTGIGWDSTSATQVNNQNRYSIYNLNINNHYCEVITRKTNLDSQFDYDHDVLISKEEKARKSILIPLDMQKSYPFINVPIFSDIENDYLRFQYLCLC